MRQENAHFDRDNPPGAGTSSDKGGIVAFVTSV
jgi:hypothetical protein